MCGRRGQGGKGVRQEMRGCEKEGESVTRNETGMEGKQQGI